MGRSTKDSWLEGPGDLREATVEDVPVKGSDVRVRGLAAAYSNQAQSEATELKTVEARGGRQEQIVTINTARLEVLQFAHGVIEPEFTVEEASRIAEKFGPAFKKVIGEIDQLSGLDKEAIEKAEARFPRSGGLEAGENGSDSPAGSGGSDLPVRAGAGTKDAD